ncbi:hypothetical protein FJ527_01045 [Mesorhizobium sp. B2-4-18]|uniref:hypothetical protein n=1 Tax=Mesorhizobium sp. B2-4-18 TaxID=2589931 RepID=UPI00112915B6|nr:hypothetical protein [Mesorhizobium sp. B2-4-18]TPK80393.1 hypothetical protein FJ527_01045 [Mesorhizobium sp. B2-4-18]
MSAVCRVPHCGLPTASRYSGHCRRHKSIIRRQGHHEQQAIRRSELRPYCDRAHGRIAKNAGSPIWAQLESRWQDLVASARTDAGRRIGNRYQRAAANELVNIAGDVPFLSITVTVCAMFMLRHDLPHRFASDAAFRIQLARRVRSLSSQHRGTCYDDKSGKQHWVYRELRPKVGAILGQNLSVVFGAVGLHLGALEERDRQQKQAEKRRFYEAMRGLK